MKLLNVIHRCDVFVFFWLFHASAQPKLTRICRVISKTGDGQMYAAIMLFFAWHDGIAARPFVALVLAFALERPLYFILKNGFKRNRPQQALPNFISSIRPSDQFSFPSGHSSAVFMVATILSRFFPPLVLLLYFWAALVAFSRVVLGVHFPTDTLVGASMGTAIALLTLNQVL
jgi:undecaprenyl-diphosphatase